MPRRLLEDSAGESPPPSSRHHLSRIGAASFGGASAFSILLLFALCFKIVTKKRTVPSTDDKVPRLFPFAELRRTTKNFSPSFRIGQGGFGSVYRATVSPQLEVAVKLMDSGSLQGEREFQNELLFASKVNSPHTVTAIGYSTDSKRNTMVLLYELMPNGNLQDALLHRKCEELASWKKRFDICVDIAKGIGYLHGLDPPVIHGDIKPSNVLLDRTFNAKIADFGLAWVREKNPLEEKILSENEGKTEHAESVDDGVSVAETESVITSTTIAGIEEFTFGIDQSPDIQETIETPPDDNTEKNWWWKQENPSNSVSGGVKDYVMEWIGTEINKEGGKEKETPSPSPSPMEAEKKKTLPWWKHRKQMRTMKRKEPREWWKEDYCEELERKKRKKRKENLKSGEEWWPRDCELGQSKRKNKRSHTGSLDWLSGELFRANRDSPRGGEVAKSGGVSSTPSMRGTVCYAAPEYNGGSLLSEKADVYSYGVLLLVVVSGRRPLQVATSPASNFVKANLIHWARHLSRQGNLLQVVDETINSVDKEEAMRCLTVALMCLQKSPSRRPSMEDVVKMLTKQTDVPCFPAEVSPSSGTTRPIRPRPPRDRKSPS